MLQRSYIVKPFKDFLHNLEFGDLESCYKALENGALSSVSNDDPRLTFDLAAKRPDLLPSAFIWKKTYKNLYFNITED